MSSPPHFGSGIYLFTWILLGTSQQLESFFAYAYFHMHVAAFLHHICNFLISTVSHIF